MRSVLSDESKKLAGHPSGEDRFGRYPHSQDPDGVMRLDGKSKETDMRGHPYLGRR